ncbi:MAG TPA: DNA/RNA non-specific endonuclease [Gemmatimonadaceae bacterium]
MRLRPHAALLLPAALAVAFACADRTVVGPAASALESSDARPAFAVTATLAPAVRLAEVHYDNDGTDAGEAIEISGPAGADLGGWSVVLYNGANGAAYSTRALSGSIPATCGERGVIVLDYPVNGIQNGSPDGVALVDASGVVVEFLSYEGTFTAVGGPADGLSSTDIGVRQGGSDAIGLSLQRQPDGGWAGPAPSTFGACNDGDTNPEPPAPVATVVVTPETATIDAGATQSFAADARDAEGEAVIGAPIVWSSDDTDVAAVSAAGVATGVAPGTARIVATAPSGAADTAMLTVTVVGGSLPPVRFSEIHYDNFDVDVGETIEVEGPAGTDLAGWSIVLYNGNGGAPYATRELSGAIPAMCDGRGVLAVAYPSNGIQNGAPDGFALIDAAGAVVEFLSYEGTFTAAGGPADGIASTDIGVAQSSAPLGQSLRRDAAGVWTVGASSLGACNSGGGPPPPPPGNSITFGGRTAGDTPLPVGFEDQVFATLRDGTGTAIPTRITWTSETPALARVDEDGVVTALGEGTMILRATAEDGTTATHALPARIATASTTARYEGNTEFGVPRDADPSDDIVLEYEQFTSSFSLARGTPNWVSYDLEATHFGNVPRCDCFTYDPALPASGRITTADYTSAGTAAGYAIDRGHLVRSFDREAGTLDNARTYLFSNIVPQAADNNQGPWSAMEDHLGGLAQSGASEVYVVAGVAGSRGTLKNEGKVTIPAFVWKVAVILPRDRGLEDVDAHDDVEVVAAIMPNEPGVRGVPWRSYETTVDAVEALSGYDLLALLPDPIEIAVESGTQPPVAAVDGPWTALPGEPVTMSAAGSSDADGDALAFSWRFGDGAAAAGETATHAWAASGTYAVRLVATDPLGLADTVASTTTVLTLAQGVATAMELAVALGDAGALDAGSVRALLATLEAAKARLEGGDVTPARGALGAALHQLDALVRSRRLTTAAATPLREMIERVIRAAS